jgi:hypothetical protein
MSERRIVSDEKIEKTKTRRYPPEVDDADIELIMKEWKLTGYEVYSEGDIVLVADPGEKREDSCVAYQRRDGAWYWINIPLLNRLVSRHEETQRQEVMTTGAHLMGEFNKGLLGDE